jgi:hypothetical protein
LLCGDDRIVSHRCDLETENGEEKNKIQAHERVSGDYVMTNLLDVAGDSGRWPIVAVF